MRIPHPTEHLARRRQIAEDDAIERNDRDDMPPASGTSWPNSSEDWLFCHWPIIPRFVE
jgi:hypothetical protein